EIEPGELEVEPRLIESAHIQALLDLALLLRLDPGRLGALDGDLLLIELLLELRGVELHEEIALLHERAFRNDVDDRARSFELTEDLLGAERANRATIVERDHEIAARHLERELSVDEPADRLDSVPRPRPGAATDQGGENDADAGEPKPGPPSWVSKSVG